MINNETISGNFCNSYFYLILDKFAKKVDNFKTSLIGFYQNIILNIKHNPEVKAEKIVENVKWHKKMIAAWFKFKCFLLRIKWYVKSVEVLCAFLDINLSDNKKDALHRKRFGCIFCQFDQPIKSNEYFIQPYHMSFLVSSN